MAVKEKAAAMGVSMNTYYKMVKAGNVKDEQQETSNSRKSTKSKGKVSTKKPASKSKAKAEEFQIEIAPPKAEKIVQKVKAFEVPEVKSETKAAAPKASKKKTEKTAVLQDMKEKLGEIIPRAYNLGKMKDWEETVNEINCKQIDVNVTISDVPKQCNEFQVKMYVLDLAKKAGYAVAKFGFTDKGYAFTLVGPISTF